MAEKIYLVQGDSRPDVICELSDQKTGDPVAIDGATARMKFRKVGVTTTLTTLTGTLLPGVTVVAADGTSSVSVDAPYNVAGAGGRVQFVWGATDLNIDAGDYEGEIEVTFSNNKIQTVYDVLKFKVREDFN